MKITSRALVLLLGISLVAGSCSSSRKVAKSPKKTDMLENQKILESLTKEPFSYNFLHARAKVRVESPDLNITGAVQFRIKPGEAIWASVTKFGLEAFRLYMTADTVRVIDRLNRSYVEEPVEKWMEAHQLPFGLRDVETILLGKGLIPDGALYHIESDEFQSGVSVNFKDFVVKYLLKNTVQPQLTEMSIKDPAGKSLKIMNSEFDFVKIGHGTFPFHRDVQKMSGDFPFNRLEISFNDVTLDQEKPMPFEIPRRYEKMEL